MKIRNFICLSLLALSLSANAETRLNVRGGLSLSSSDITAISTESVQQKDSYTGWFVGPALTMERNILGLDFGIMYAQNSMDMLQSDGVTSKKYTQQWIDIPLSLRLKFGFDKLCLIGQFGPQWNFNLNDVDKFFTDGTEIESNKIVTTANIGAGVRLFDKIELMLNFNCPWDVVADNFDDFDKMGDLIGDTKTIQFVFGWRF